MHNLNDYVTTIVQKGFPELAKTNIKPDFSKMKDAYFEFERHSRLRYSIFVDSKLEKRKDSIVIGGLAHEMAHISKEVKLPYFLSRLEGFLYDHIPFYQTLDERRTDTLVIERGFGPELLDFVTYANKKRRKYNSSDGLTKKEIVNMLEKTKFTS